MALALPALVLATGPRAQTAEHGSLAGQLLVASPTIGDPRFDRTVILMVEHTPQGAFGIAINLPMGERPVAKLLEMLGDNDATVSGDVRIFAGGPVQPTAGFVVHSSDYRRDGTVIIDARLAVTASREIVRDIGSNHGPKQSLVAFGYAGWGPGQLQGELERGAWVTAPADPKLIFDAARDKVWDLAFALHTKDL
jgi:putative transcriptional regulator